MPARSGPGSETSGCLAWLFFRAPATGELGPGAVGDSGYLLGLPGGAPWSNAACRLRPDTEAPLMPSLPQTPTLCCCVRVGGWPAVQELLLSPTSPGWPVCVASNLLHHSHGGACWLAEIVWPAASGPSTSSPAFLPAHEHQQQPEVERRRARGKL